jgi:hypothetical protein
MACILSYLYHVPTCTLSWPLAGPDICLFLTIPGPGLHPADLCLFLTCTLFWPVPSPGLYPVLTFTLFWPVSCLDLYRIVSSPVPWPELWPFPDLYLVLTCSMSRPLFVNCTLQSCAPCRTLYSVLTCALSWPVPWLALWPALTASCPDLSSALTCNLSRPVSFMTGSLPVLSCTLSWPSRCPDPHPVLLCCTALRLSHQLLHHVL